MSEANSAIHGLYRRKVTLACGSCRKRRVKCSGNQPCALCYENGRECAFDGKNRGRRGPRPRQSVSQIPRIIHPLAPRIAPTDLRDHAWNPHEGRQILQTETGVDVAERGSRDDIRGDDTRGDDTRGDDIRGDDIRGDDNGDGGGDDDGDGGDVDDDDYNDDDDSIGGEDDSSDPLAWRSGLEELLYHRNPISKSLPVLDMDLVCHLLHMFCARATAQLRLLLPPARIQHHLFRGTMSRALVLAMCASGMRFSVHKGARGTHAQRFADIMEQEAQQWLCPSRVAWQQVDGVKTVCVLVDYYASRSRGRQAWVNIAMGQSLVQLARSNYSLDAEQTQVLDVAERYLEIARASHSLGHRYLQPRVAKADKRPRSECGPCPEDCPHLIELLDVFASVHHLYSTPFPKQNPPPWAADSEFRSLQDELEEYLLRHPVTFRFGSNLPRSNCDAKRGLREDLDASVSSLVWHCCAIALNRAFLLVPERPLGAEATTRGQLEPTTIAEEFPDAPSLFLRERIHRCESSADAICSISRDIIKNGGFYSHAVLVGFACAQSALVSINRLHRASEPYDDRVVDNLKLACIVLGAVQVFYAPAKEWMDVVFRAHNNTNTMRFEDMQGSEMLYMQEPVFMRLDPEDGNSASREAEGDGSETFGEITMAVPGVSQTGQDGRTPADTSSVWLQAYTDHLSGDIDADDMDTDEPNLSEHGHSSPVHAINPPPPPAPPPAPPQPTISTGAQTMHVPAVEEDHRHEHDLRHDQSVMDVASHVSKDFPVHMAGAILTSMSGGTPDFALQAPQQVDSHMNDIFSELFGQLPAFEMPTPASMLLGMGSAAGDGNMWGDVFNQQMLK